MARSGERVLYNPSGATFTIYAPTGPSRGDQFAIKNVSNSTNTLTVNGNSRLIEPLFGFSMSSSIGVAGAGDAATWEYVAQQGVTGWILVARVT
jgi:hypothetical protein